VEWTNDVASLINDKKQTATKKTSLRTPLVGLPRTPLMTARRVVAVFALNCIACAVHFGDDRIFKGALALMNVCLLGWWVKTVRGNGGGLSSGHMPGDGGGLESSSTAAKRRSILAGSGGGSGSPGRSRSNSAATEEETNMPIGGGKAAPMGGPARSDGGGAKVTIGITNATPHPAGSKLDLDQGLPTAKRATMCTLPRCDPENLQVRVRG
jgi:hypothetical protein